MSKPRGTLRREALLTRAGSTGIALHCENGSSYTRDMKRLVSDGLADLRRVRFGWGNARYTRLSLTEKGRQHLVAQGLPDPTEPKPSSSPPLNLRGHVPDAPRRVLFGAERRLVHVMRDLKPDEPVPPSPGQGFWLSESPPEQIAAPPVVYVVWEFNDEAAVFLWAPTASWHPANLSFSQPRVGRLRKTGRGFKLVPYLNLAMRLPSPFAKVSDEDIQNLKEMAPGVHVSWFRLRSVAFVLLRCNNKTEQVVAKLCFPTAFAFEGVEEFDEEIKRHSGR